MSAPPRPAAYRFAIFPAWPGTGSMTPGLAPFVNGRQTVERHGVFPLPPVLNYRIQIFL
jgi:hypothetical protein